MFWISEKRHEREIDQLNERLQYYKDQLGDADEKVLDLTLKNGDRQRLIETAQEELQRVTGYLTQLRDDEDAAGRFMREDATRLDFMRESNHINVVPVTLDYIVHLENKLKDLAKVKETKYAKETQYIKEARGKNEPDGK